MFLATILSTLTALPVFAQTGWYASGGTEIVAVDYVGEAAEGRILFSVGAGRVVKFTTKKNDGTEEKVIITNELDLNPISIQIARSISDPTIAAFKVEVLEADYTRSDRKIENISFTTKIAEVRFERMFDDNFQVSIGQWGVRSLVNDNEKTPITVMIGSSLVEFHHSNRPEIGGDKWVAWIPLVRGQINVVHNFTSQFSLQAQATSTIWLTPRFLGDGIDSDLLQGATLEASVGVEYQLQNNLILTAGVTTNANYLYYDSESSPEGPFTKDLGITAGVGIKLEPCTRHLRNTGRCIKK